MRKGFGKYIPLLILLIMAFTPGCSCGAREREVYSEVVHPDGWISRSYATVTITYAPQADGTPEPEPTATVTLTPQAAETPEPAQFTVSGEFVYTFSGEFKDCPPGKGRLTFRLWNVGEQGGDEFAFVEVVLFELPSAYFEKITASEDRGACITEDYYFSLSGAEDVTFSGGPNGTIEGWVLDEEKQLWVRSEWGWFVDGEVLVLSMGGEIPVSDPSVFDGF